AVQRFQRRTGRTDRPAPDDAAWLRFRRDEVTALVRRTYLELLARRPALKVSAATITFAPGITTTAQWPTSAAYSEVLQDWRAWLEEGLLDLNVPMAYFDQRQYAQAWANWSLFAKDHAYGRHVALGGALYLNTISNSLGQIRSTRTATPAGRRAQGFAGYSYHATSDGGTRAQFLDALTLAGAQNPDPPFAEPAPVPEMPWKTSPATGHLLGQLHDPAAGGGAEDVVVTLCGPVNRAFLTDANGFFGVVELPPGAYTAFAALGDRAATNVFHVQPGLVATNLLELPAALPPAAPREARVSAGADAAVVSFTTATEAAARIELGASPCALATVRSLPPATRHSVWLGGLPSARPLCLRVVTTAPDGAEHAGPVLALSPAGNSLVDNRDAALSGPWSLGTSAAGKHGPDYAFAGTAATATATAIWPSGRLVPGRYDVRLIFPPGGNRSARAPFELVTPGGTNLVLVDQTAAGVVAAWTNVALPADGAFVRLRNNTGESGRLVLADAVEFRWRPEQDALDPANPPAWWTQHFFPGTPPPPGDDADGDGLTNGEEFVAGTDPTDARSQPWLRLAPQPPGGVALTAGPAAGERRYLALRQASLPGAVTRLGPLAVDAPAGLASMVDTGAPPAAGFYRLEISPADP
ncbi:MAG: family 10 glycosylhydrolase, partial [Limisphaerales bacterium]